MDWLDAHNAVPMLTGLALLKDMPQGLSHSVVLWSLARLATDSPEHVPCLKRGSPSWDAVNSFFCGCKCPSTGHPSWKNRVKLDCISLSTIKSNMFQVWKQNVEQSQVSLSASALRHVTGDLQRLTPQHLAMILGDVPCNLKKAQVVQAEVGFKMTWLLSKMDVTSK